MDEAEAYHVSDVCEMLAGGLYLRDSTETVRFLDGLKIRRPQ
jgi:hypothetical protein